MAEYIEREATNADVSEKNKIKTHFAHVIVERYHGKPYYNILYFDSTDRDYHIGFGSYNLEYVFKWLDEEFEIVEAPAANLVEVKRGRWVKDRRVQVMAEVSQFLRRVWVVDPAAQLNFCGADMRERAAEGGGPYREDGGGDA